jgi:hypothetical protein
MKFFIKGKIHFGWARLTVTLAKPVMNALLIDYAYETIPNKPIIAGKTEGHADDPTKKDLNPAASLTNPNPDNPRPASLGALAMGVPGLSPETPRLRPNYLAR